MMPGDIHPIIIDIYNRLLNDLMSDIDIAFAIKGPLISSGLTCVLNFENKCGVVISSMLNYEIEDLDDFENPDWSEYDGQTDYGYFTLMPFTVTDDGIEHRCLDPFLNDILAGEESDSGIYHASTVKKVVKYLATFIEEEYYYKLHNCYNY